MYIFFSKWMIDIKSCTKNTAAQADQLCTNFSEHRVLSASFDSIFLALKRVLSLAVETDERAKRKNTGFTGTDRIRSRRIISI